MCLGSKPRCPSSLGGWDELAVTYQESGVTGTLAVTVIAAAPNTLVLSTNATHVANDGTAISVTGQLYDRYNNPVPNAGVNVTLSARLCETCENEFLQTSW